MRLFSILSSLLLAILVTAEPHTASIYLQPVVAAPTEPAPALLAEVHYDTAVVDSTKVLNFEFPELPEGAEHVRIGVYDAKAKRWASSTSLAHVDNFSKGYAPTIILTVNPSGRDVVGVAFKGVLIDAGQTRDFGPSAVVHEVSPGKQPELNKPVVLSPGGRKVVEEEKTFLQKYDALGVVINSRHNDGLVLILEQVLVVDSNWSDDAGYGGRRRREEIIDWDRPFFNLLPRMSPI
jgi:hypothetical protein